jgi:hypothetical protein
VYSTEASFIGRYTGLESYVGQVEVDFKLESFVL